MGRYCAKDAKHDPALESEDFAVNVLLNHLGELRGY